MADIPSVKVFENITPSNSGTGEDLLRYDHLPLVVEEYKLSNAERSSRVWDSKDGSLEELKSAKQLAMEYLLRTSFQGVRSTTAEGHDLWADRFTLASIELYGEPDKAEVMSLVSVEMAKWISLEGSDTVSQGLLEFLQKSYQKIFGPNLVSKAEDNHDAEAEAEQRAIRAYGEVLREKFGPVFDLVDKSGKEEFMPEDLQELFNQAFAWLAANSDPGWSEWKSVPNDSSNVSTERSSKEIRVGIRRVSATKEEAKKLLAHELFVHVLRAQNASHSSEPMLLSGFPGYVDIEEGLGKLSEQAFGENDEIPGGDRYIDIAIALSEANGTQITRQDLFLIHLARSIVWSQSHGEYKESELTERIRSAWGSVDRVYRGGHGDNEGHRQSVYTKDIAYYVGTRKMSEYLSSQFASGKPMTEVFDYLALGSFDPTNPRDIERVDKAKQTS
ncbi:MAG TPA: hypothetical protein VIH90_02130 [Candidatus Saccharimonadales bacterium]